MHQSDNGVRIRSETLWWGNNSQSPNYEDPQVFGKYWKALQINQVPTSTKLPIACTLDTFHHNPCTCTTSGNAWRTQFSSLWFLFMNCTPQTVCSEIEDYMHPYSKPQPFSRFCDAFSSASSYLMVNQVALTFTASWSSGLLILLQDVRHGRNLTSREWWILFHIFQKRFKLPRLCQTQTQLFRHVQITSPANTSEILTTI